MSKGQLAAMQLQGWKPEQADKAIKSLQKFVGKQQAKGNSLFEEDELFYLTIALKATPQLPRKDKPIHIGIPHPLYTAEGAEVCLFVKDHKGEGHKQAKARLEQLLKSGHIAKIVGLSKLRTKYESHEAKRKLCNSYDIFLADDRVIPVLPKLLGKSFFKKKKQPVPVHLKAKDFPAAVKKAVEATYMTAPAGTCITVRVARSSFTQQQIADNIAAALPAIVAHIPKKWNNVAAVYLKTGGSASLPIYQVLPDQPQKIAAAAAAPAVAEAE